MRSRVQFINSNTLSGATFIVFAIVFGVNAATNLSMGTPTNMGPGYFPAILCGLLFVLGVAVLMSGLKEGGAELPKLPFWRVSAVLVSPLIFAATVQGGGIVIAIFLAAFVAALAGNGMTPLKALLTAAGLSALCVVLFSELLKLPLQPFGHWFR